MIIFFGSCSVIINSTEPEMRNGQFCAEGINYHECRSIFVVCLREDFLVKNINIHCASSYTIRFYIGIHIFLSV